MTDQPSSTAGAESRQAWLATRLQAVRQRIEAACTAAGRDSAELTLIAVTKTRPAGDVRAIAALGVPDIGENRDQEAARKADALADLDVRWHFVGQLQRNKVASVTRYADVVHSVDRRSLVDALTRACASRVRPLACLVQISLDGDPRRGGASVDEVAGLADAIEKAPKLSLGGVMAIAPRGTDPDERFERLERIAARLRENHPHAGAVSAGMSGDLEAALRHGATHLRVGSALFGARPGPVG
jgi:pyridoxal phosphate enzyme (YggS family)